MQRLDLNLDGEKLSTLLFLGAHCDDIEIGCGGTILQLAEKYRNARFVWVIFSSNPTRAAETHESHGRFLELIENKSLLIEQFRNGYFPYVGDGIKDCFENLKKSVDPDCIFTHYRDDRHQDHRTISDLTWNTFRDHLILEYEIPKYDGDFGPANVFVPLSDDAQRKKVEIILESFHSQRDRKWFDAEMFEGLMRLRGMECNAESGYAEAYYCRKLVF